jgi:MFS family permease
MKSSSPAGLGEAPSAGREDHEVARGPSGRRVGLGVASLCLVQFIDVLGVTVVVTALPVMLTDFHASADAGSLIGTGYAMFFAGLLMLGARLGDKFGHRRVILAGLVLFAAAAVVAATAGSVMVLTAARCLQGAAAAITVPSALRLLTTITVDGPQRRRAIALWSAAGAAAGASGFVVGGIGTDLVGWRAVFWAYLPLALALAAAVARSVPVDLVTDRSQPLGAHRACVFTASVMVFVVATTLLPQPGQLASGAGLLAAAILLAAAFIAVDRRATAPLLPLALLRKHRLRQGAIAALLNTLTTSSVITLAALYLQNTLARSPLLAAALLMPFSLGVIAGSALAAPSLGHWVPQQVVAAGLTAIAVCDAAIIPAAPSPWALPVTVAVGGAGIGLSSVAATGLGTSVAGADRSTASGIINTAAQLGTALGIAVLLLTAAVTTGAPGTRCPAPAVAWALAAGISLTAAAAFLRSARRPSDNTSHGRRAVGQKFPSATRNEKPIRQAVKPVLNEPAHIRLPGIARAAVVSNVREHVSFVEAGIAKRPMSAADVRFDPLDGERTGRAFPSAPARRGPSLRSLPTPVPAPADAWDGCW